MVQKPDVPGWQPEGLHGLNCTRPLALVITSVLVALVVVVAPTVVEAATTVVVSGLAVVAVVAGAVVAVVADPLKIQSLQRVVPVKQIGPESCLMAPVPPGPCTKTNGLDSDVSTKEKQWYGGEGSLVTRHGPAVPDLHPEQRLSWAFPVESRIMLRSCVVVVAAAVVPVVVATALVVTPASVVVPGVGVGVVVVGADVLAVVKAVVAPNGTQSKHRVVPTGQTGPEDWSISKPPCASGATSTSIDRVGAVKVKQYPRPSTSQARPRVYACFVHVLAEHMLSCTWPPALVRILLAAVVLPAAELVWGVVVVAGAVVVVAGAVVGNTVDGTVVVGAAAVVAVVAPTTVQSLHRAVPTRQTGPDV